MSRHDKDREPTGRRPTPYWLASGTEPCEACAFTHALEVEIRCFSCDASLCPYCVIRVWETREAFCAECHAAAEEET